MTKLEAYDLMWRKLESHYKDVGASVSSNRRRLVELINETEWAYSPLEELGKLKILTMRDVHITK